ncbi:MAG: terminase [Aminipila sp.]
MLKLSPKFKDFLSVVTEREYLEGTTAAGKTTVGIFKFMLMVARSEIKYHVIAGADLGTVEKNVLNSERGLLEQFEGLAEYYGNGKGNTKLPHVEYETSKGKRIIYICGYDNKKRWQKVLGGQVGCVYIDEVNIADMEFVREITHRCEYMMTTSNPDNPDLPIYKEFINRSRPLEKYKKDYPEELISELNEQAVEGWVHWYFTFYDNAAMTHEQIQKKINSVAVGTKMYKNKIQGLRGRATGLIFNVKKENIITKEDAKKFKYEVFSCGVDTSYSRNSDDKFSFIFSGITNCRKKITLAERCYNNKDRTEPLSPSDIPPLLVDFMNQCTKEFGFAKNVFIDSADQATILECQKYKKRHGSIYVFGGAWKKTMIIDRINLQGGWMAHGDFLIVEDCKETIRELNTYSWQEDKDKPEDGNDHMINADQYSWLPYKERIGSVVKED